MYPSPEQYYNSIFVKNAEYYALCMEFLAKKANFANIDKFFFKYRNFR